MTYMEIGKNVYQKIELIDDMTWEFVQCMLVDFTCVLVDDGNGIPF